MTKFKYSKDGTLNVIRDGKKIGEVVTMGDLIGGNPLKGADEDEHQIHLSLERSGSRR